MQTSTKGKEIIQSENVTSPTKPLEENIGKNKESKAGNQGIIIKERIDHGMASDKDDLESP